MKQRKNYVAPTMEVVELELQGSLLASSDYDATIENGNLEGFEDGWN